MALSTLDSVNSNQAGSSTFGGWSDFAQGVSQELWNPQYPQSPTQDPGAFQSPFTYGGAVTGWFENQAGNLAQHFTPTATFSGSQYLFPFNGRPMSTGGQGVFNFSGLSNATQRVANITGWLGVGISAWQVGDTAIKAFSNQNNPSLTLHELHDQAGSAYGLTGGLLGTAAGEILAAEFLAGAGLAGGAAFAVSFAVPILVGLAAGAVLHGFFNWVFPEHNATPVTPSLGNTNASPNVGGVLFDKCAVASGLLPEIASAYWDAHRGVLVLVGPAAAGTPSNHIVPGLEFDNLIVALRAALVGAHMGVSIDPPAEYRDGIQRGTFPPIGTPMYVSYLGNTAGTLFGAIMFEADRVMKCLSNGTDNVTGRALRAQKITGYGTLFDLFNHFKSGGSGSWFRFWFVIDIVEISHDSSAKALRFGSVGIKVLNETELHGGEKAKQDPACAAFAKHLTEHYDEYAVAFPVFARLKEIAKLSALARFLVNQGVAIDSRSIFNQRILPVTTPSTTPGICVSAPSSNGGSQSLFGGVDMDADPTITNKDDLDAVHIRENAEFARPGEIANTWRFKTTDGPAIASSMRLGRVQRPYRALASSDHAFQESWRDTVLSIQRYYDSSMSGGDFGPGWWLFLPYRLEVIPPSRKRREVRLRVEEIVDDAPAVVTLHNFISPGTQIYRRCEEADNGEGAAYCRLNHQELVKGSISYSLDESDALHWRDGFYALSDGKYFYQFNEKGQLCETKRGQSVLANYKWSDGLLVAIDYPGGRGYAIHYTDTFQLPHISEIVASDGVSLRYGYNKVGCLQECMNRDTSKVSYRYDRNFRLSETRNGDGIVVRRNAYDSIGNAVDGAESTIHLSDGTNLRRKFASGRTSVVTDESGSLAEFSYRKDGSLAFIRARTTNKDLWVVESDECGRLVAVGGSLGMHRSIFYHADGTVRRVEGADGSWMEFPASDEKRKELTGAEVNGKRWSAKLDDFGLLDTIIDSAGQKHRFHYRKNEFRSVQSPGWTCEVVRNNGMVELKTKSSSGVKRRLVLDRSGAKAEFSLSGPEKDVRSLTVEEAGCKIKDCAGTVVWRSDKQALTYDVTFEF